jgi:signal peptidase I
MTYRRAVVSSGREDVDVLTQRQRPPEGSGDPGGRHPPTRRAVNRRRLFSRRLKAAAVAGLVASALAGSGAAATEARADPVGAILRGELGGLNAGILDGRYQPLEAVTATMEPNLRLGDRLLIDRHAYEDEPISRGDVVAHRLPASQDVCGASGSLLINRIVGLPGDRLQVPPGKPEVIVNGTPYPVPGAAPNRDTGRARYRVPEGKLFVLGDNRPISCDSMEFGFLSAADVRGRVTAIYHPRTRVSRALPDGTFQRVDVTESPLRPRFDYALELGRSAETLWPTTDKLRRCAEQAACRELRYQRVFERDLGMPVSRRSDYLRDTRLELARRMTMTMRGLHDETSRLRGDCAAPVARRLRTDLLRDRRIARSAAMTPARARTIAISTERHLDRALRRTFACWG